MIYSKAAFSDKIFIAPEIIRSEIPTSKTDIFGFGMVVLYLLAKQKGKSVVSDPEKATGLLREIGREDWIPVVVPCLQDLPEHRPSSDILLKTLIPLTEQSHIELPARTEVKNYSLEQAMKMSQMNHCECAEFYLKELALKHGLTPDVGLQFGIISLKLGRGEEALKYINSYWKTLENKGEPQKEIEVSLLLNKVYNLIGKFKEGLEISTKIEKKLVELNGPDCLILKKCYNAQGYAHFQQGEYKAAIECYKNAERIMEKCTGSKRDLAMVNLRLGICSNILEQESKSYFEKARIYANEIPKAVKRKKGIYNLIIGRIEGHNNNQELALIHLTQSIEDCSLQNGDYHYSLAHILCCYSEILCQLEKKEAALNFLEQARLILRRTFPEDNHLFGMLYRIAGDACMGSQRKKEGHEYFQKAISVYCKISKDHSMLARIYYNVGIAAKHQEEYSKALALFQEAESISRKNFPESNTIFGYIYGNMGMILSQQKDCRKAVEHFQKALSIMKKACTNEKYFLFGK